MNFKTVEWKNNQVILIDQRKLPLEESYITCSTHEDVGVAIRDMIVRGAPAIGVTAAMGVALGAQGFSGEHTEKFFEHLDKVCDSLVRTRPTAVNLQWAVQRMRLLADQNKSTGVTSLKKQLVQEAIHIYNEDIAANKALGEYGQVFINDGDVVLTHCNAGALATAGWGTALGVLYSARAQGKNFEVYADETRPFLQGARLTTWELHKNNIPTTLITDNMAASLMRQRKIHKVIVGADRIAANGDVANKIGTYGVAVLAWKHDLPFYVAAPLSTIDTTCATGDSIPIEERPREEVIYFQKQRIAPEGIRVRNPSFDVTPHDLVTAIITEKGVVHPPYKNSIANLF